MRLKALKLRDFRGYQGWAEVDFDADLTALIGRNDSGKSSILDALGIFFESRLVRLERDDLCVYAEGAEVRIGCVFTDLPQTIVLDALAETSLEDEYLTNADGDLEIHKVYDCTSKNPKARVVAVSRHPAAEGARDLLTTKNQGLKQRLRSLRSPEGVDQRKNPELRRAIWEATPDLHLQDMEIELNKEDAKEIWNQVQRHLPLFALFRADRPSTDEDTEVQDPMREAVRQALAELGEKLRNIEDEVRSATLEVAERTLDKLEEIDPASAEKLSPEFRSEPKWEGIFKLALTTDDDIPVNKRGSGFRRLLLLAFFRAEAERRVAAEEKARGVIYAVEEPETSQHPRNQKLVVEALKELAAADAAQVILTTHVPGLAELIPTESMRYIRVTDDRRRAIQDGSGGVLEEIAEDLGVLPDSRVRVLVCVEGPHDVALLKCLIKKIHVAGVPDAFDPESPEIVFLPVGGSTLRAWVDAHYLKSLRRPEIHIYDRGSEEPPKYAREVEGVNSRADGSRAFLTAKREAENYLHGAVIKEILGIDLKVTDEMDVPLEVARATHRSSDTDKAWDELSDDKRRKKESRAKRRLNREVAQAMTVEYLEERSGYEEIVKWCRAIRGHLP